jgi:hypothetical protein
VVEVIWFEELKEHFVVYVNCQQTLCLAGSPPLSHIHPLLSPRRAIELSLSPLSLSLCLAISLSISQARPPVNNTKLSELTCNAHVLLVISENPRCHSTPKDLLTFT